MKKLIISTLLLLFVSVSHPALANKSDNGGQFKQLGQWQVHYIAFPSTFIQPHIAKSYNLVRSNQQAIVNISVLKQSTSQHMKAQQVSVSGTAKNLLGTTKKLTFKEVKEGDAIYYLAQLDYHNEEIYRFEITLTQGAQSQVLKFQQKFYVD